MVSKYASFSGQAWSLDKIVSILWLVGQISIASFTTVTRDFCEGEIFKALCSFDEVVVMRNAVYGRMRLNKCVKVDMGYLGCQSNVIDLADDKCSGRRTCEISVPDTTFENTQPCLELKSYLEASYDCIKVLTVDANECQKSKFLRAHQQSGSIASVTAHETYCGTVDTPWLIQGSIGQRINITLTDFNAQRRDADFVHFESCHKYATIIERESSKQSVAVCGRRSRFQQVFVSDGHIVQIQIETRRVSYDYFIISYEIYGCSDPMVSDNAWFKRFNNSATVGCRHTSEKWAIYCENRRWTGDTGNCTYYTSIELIERSNREEKYDSTGFLIAMLCFMVFLTTMITILLSILLYRRHLRQRSARQQTFSNKGTESDLKTYEDDELSSYVRPYKNHRYGKYHDHHHHHNRQNHRRQHEHDSHLYRSRSGSIGSKDTNYSANYEKVGSCKIINKYTHIWEMPLPNPGE